MPIECKIPKHYLYNTVILKVKNLFSLLFNLQAFRCIFFLYKRQRYISFSDHKRNNLEGVKSKLVNLSNWFLYRWFRKLKTSPFSFITPGIVSWLIVLTVLEYISFEDLIRPSLLWVPGKKIVQFLVMLFNFLLFLPMVHLKTILCYINYHWIITIIYWVHLPEDNQQCQPTLPED